MKKLILSLSVVAFVAAAQAGNSAKASSTCSKMEAKNATASKTCCSKCCKAKKQALASPKAAAEKRG